MVDPDMVRVLGRSAFHDTALTSSGALAYLGGEVDPLLGIVVVAVVSFCIHFGIPHLFKASTRQISQSLDRVYRITLKLGVLGSFCALFLKNFFPACAVEERCSIRGL